MAKVKVRAKAVRRLGSVFAFIALAGLALWWAQDQAQPRVDDGPGESASSPPAGEIVQAGPGLPGAAWSPCHEEELTAADVPIRSVDGHPPKVAGGELRDGVYDVADYRVFGRPREGALSATFRQTMVIEQRGGIAKNVRIGRTGQVETTVWATSISGAALTLRGVCPAAVQDSQETVDFGMQGDELVMSFEQAGLPVQVTYRRRSG